MTSFRPHPLLRRQVVALDVIEKEGGDTLVLPSTSAVLGFQFRGRVRAGETPLALAGVTGVQRSARTYSYAPKTGSILVRFTPQGAACLGVPAAELSERSVELDAILPAARVAAAHEALASAPDDAARVAVIERLLLELPYVEDRVVARAVELLGAPGDTGVAAVAAAVGLGERQLERRFLARVGLTPKRFATLRRFEQALARAETAPSLCAAALAAGYYDQAHFNRDFRRFAGVPPGALLARRR